MLYKCFVFAGSDETYYIYLCDATSPNSFYHPPPNYISFFHFSISNIFANMNNLIDRVSEAQIEVSENFN